MYDVAYFLHILGIVLALPASFAYVYLGISLQKAGKKEVSAFVQNIRFIHILGNAGFGLLTLTGVYLLLLYWENIEAMPLLIAKLILVPVLLGLLIFLSITSRKQQKNNELAYLKSLSVLAWIALVIALAIMVLAVKIFH